MQSKNDFFSTYNSFKQNLVDHGLDLCHEFDICEYNQERETAQKLESFSRQSCFGILIGNSKKIWPKFITTFERDSECRLSSDPFDYFIMQTIERELQSIGVSYKLRYSHIADPEYLAFQKIAQFSGLAYLSPAHLCIHPEFGPWISLRAVISFDIDCVQRSGTIAKHCENCKKNCELEFQQLMQRESFPDAAGIKANWRDWLKVRASCPLGSEYRFSEQQLEYHYTKNKDLLL